MPPRRADRAAFMAHSDLDQGLPEECLSKILENLPIRDRLIYQTVSKRWSLAVRRSLYRVTSHQLQEFMEFCRDNPRLNVDKMLDTIRLCTKRMTAIIFKTTFGEEIDTAILKILARATKVKNLTLDINNIKVKTLKPVFVRKTLQELHLTVDEFDIYTLSKVMKFVKKLKHLSLTIRDAIVSTNIARYEMEAIFSVLPPAITRLMIKSNNVFALPSLFQFLAKFPKLEELKLDSNGEIHEHINHKRKTTWKAMSRLKKLKRLYLNGLKSDFNIDCFYELKSLEYLQIRGCSSGLATEQDRDQFREMMLLHNKNLKPSCLIVSNELAEAPTE